MDKMDTLTDDISEIQSCGNRNYYNTDIDESLYDSKMNAILMKLG
jgi:hypothetical protein